MNKKAVILILVAAMLVSTSSMALFSSGNPNGGDAAPVRTAISSAYTGSVTIYPNGTVSASGVLSKSGSTYTLLQNISGGLTDLMNGSSIDGAGYTITASGSTALFFQNVSNVAAYNLKVSTATYGIQLLNVINGSITNLDIQSANRGLYAVDSSYISLFNSHINASYYGIWTWYITHLSMENVTVTNSTNNAVLFAYSNYLRVQGVFGTQSVYTYATGLEADDCSNLILSGNNFSGFYYDLYFDYSTNIRSSNCTAGTAEYGALLIDYISGYHSLNDNYSGSSGYSLELSDVYNSSFQYDNMSHSAFGNYVDSGQSLLFAHDSLSNATDNGYSGLSLSGVADVNVSYDVFNQSANQYAYPMYLEGVTNISLSHDWLYNPTTAAEYGVYLSGVSSFSMNYTYDRAGIGISAAASTTGTTFNHDTFVLSYAFGDGLYFSGGINSNIVVTNSTFLATFTGDNNAYAIDVLSYTSKDVIVSNNIFAGIGYGVYLEPSDGTTASITNNTLSNDQYYAIYASYMSQVTISGNSISNVSSEGIYAFAVQSVSIMWNSVALNLTNNVYGIDVEETTSLAMIFNNTVTANSLTSWLLASSEAIYVYFNFGQTVVTGNVVTGVHYGLEIEYNNLLAVADNTVNTAYYGFYSNSNSGFQYYSNSVSGTTEAFASFSDINGTVYANTFQNASLYVLDIESSSYMLFYHNNFLNGSSMPTDFVSNTQLIWNLSLPVGGNFWSNYTGSGSNGFGTTPYTVNGTNIDYLPLTSMWSSPTLTFVETGLPSGTAWSATLGGSTMSSSSATIVFQPDNVMPVNQSFGIGSVSGYVANVTGGALQLTGSSQVVMVAFIPYTYAVTFTEAGLQSGTSWSVTLNGTTRTSTSTTITFNMPNGSYSYTISAVTNYNGGGTSGTATVSSAGVSISATFAQIMYTLTVVEAGLPSGSSWSVTVNGATHSATTPTISVPLPAGTYNVTVTGPSGYKATLQASTVTVSGSSSALSVQFSKPASSSTLLGEGIGIGVVVGIIAGVVVGMLVVPRFRKGKQQ